MTHMKDTLPYKPDAPEKLLAEKAKPESPTNPEDDSPPMVEKTEEELLAERQERQEVADEQAGSIRQAEEESQRELTKQGAEPVVAVKGLRKAFGDHEVLRGVDFHVNKGENLVILGKSGTGKSVLIKCLVGLEWPDEGEIRVFWQRHSCP
jgi:ABC-type glutathione transport system ATPase component